jgi:hypothetical protein
MAAGVQLEERKLRPLLLQLLVLQLLLAAASNASDGTRITCNDVSARRRVDCCEADNAAQRGVR